MQGRGSLLPGCKLVCLLGLLVCTGGCPSMMNPFIPIIKDHPPGNVTLSQAIEYAHVTKSKYRRALGERANTKSLLGAGLIPLGGAALGLGITGGNPVAVTALGLAGATGYGLGTWFDSTPQQRAYVVGYHAVNCAIEAMLPLNVDQHAPSFQAFLTDMKDIDNYIEEVEKRIGTVNVRLADVESTSPIALRAQQDVAAASDIVATAVAARANGVSLQYQIETAGNNLVIAVDRIAGQVDSTLVESQPSLQALAAIISGLGQSYTQFTTVPESQKTLKDVSGASVRTAQSSPAAALGDELRALQPAVAQLSTTKRRIADFINPIVAKKPLKTLEACGVDPSAVASALAVDPAGAIEFRPGVAGSQGRVITGGKGPYTVDLANVKGLSVRQPTPQGPAFVVLATTETVAGEYAISVADGSGRHTFVPVVVRASSAAGAGDVQRPSTTGGGATSAGQPGPRNTPSGPTRPHQPPGTPPVPIDRFFADSSLSDRIKIQHALCLTGNEVDATWGRRTKEALESYQATLFPPAITGVMTERIRATLLEMTEDAIEQRCKTKTLLKFRDNLLDTAFNLKGAQLSVRGTPMVDSIRQVVVVSLLISPSRTGPITEDEIKEKLLEVGRVPSMEKENIVLSILRSNP